MFLDDSCRSQCVIAKKDGTLLKEHMRAVVYIALCTFVKSETFMRHKLF